MQNTEFRDEQVSVMVGSLMVLAGVVLAAALVYTRNVMIPFVLAVFITAVVAPVADFQILRWRFPKWIAVLTTLLLVLVLLALVGILLIVTVQTIVHMAGEYSRQVVELSHRVFAELSSYGIQVDHARVSSELDARLPGVITETAGTVTTIISHSFLIVCFVVFLLLGRNPHRSRTDIYAEIESTVRGYLSTVTVLAAVTSVLVGLVLWAFGLRMAWLFGLLVFFLSYIPNIGPIVATLLPLPIALARFQNPWMIVAVIAIPGAIHMTIGNFVAPRLMGRGLELHPVTILLALAFWGVLWGIVGMLLAVPITAVLRVVFSHFQTTQPLANLLAGHLPGKSSPSA